MSDQPDKSQQTEDPTQKKLDDARNKGNLPVSRELGAFLMVLSAALLAGYLGPSIAQRFQSAMLPFVERPHEFSLISPDFDAVVYSILGEIGIILTPFLLLLICGAALSGYGQNGLVISAEKIKPKFSNLSIMKGMSRLFSKKSLVEFMKGIIKMGLVGAAAYTVISPTIQDTDYLSSLPVGFLPILMQDLSVHLLIAVAIVTAIISAADMLWQRYDWMQNLRMSKQDIKDEHKQSEGDPHIKAKLAGIRRERAQRRMMNEVPKATVIITNPTHFAVALRYEKGETKAPICVAKGQDLIALRIREVAGKHDIPIVENPPLARALFATVELDREIPEEHYKAVAEIVSFIMRTASGSKKRT